MYVKKETNKKPEVSEAMLDAGFKIFVAAKLMDEYLGADRLLLADIYRAMWRQAQQELQK
jgi:hypothetical protein